MAHRHHASILHRCEDMAPQKLDGRTHGHMHEQTIRWLYSIGQTTKQKKHHRRESALQVLISLVDWH